MSGGFWAGAVPPWAYAVGACLFILAVLLGMWAGYERGFKHAAEEQQWEREQAKTRRTHPAYRQPDSQVRTAATEPGWLGSTSFESLPSLPESAITTGEIQAITDEMDSWLAVHVYGAPADYGQWLEQQD